MDFKAKLQEMGVTLPPAPGDGACLRVIRPFGEKLLYVSGTGSLKTGKIPSQVSEADGVTAAREAAMAAVSALESYLGDLNRIKSFVKLIAFVASDREFVNQHIVANGGSQFLMDLFGEEIGKSARSAIGVASLPMDYAVEIEMLVELK